jgi:hypothetical protein
VSDTASTMRARLPAQSVIEQLLQRQSTAAPVSTVARFFGRSPLAQDSVPWYLGAQGEIAVGSMLAQLPAEWAVFHALPVGAHGADIDHLVAGPAGIFTINTKHHSRRSIWVANRSMLVAGNKVPYLGAAEHEAARVTKLLRERMPLLPPVQPVIALVDPGNITIREKPEQVKVIDARQLRSWLSGLAPVLAEPELDEIVDILDDPSTWRPFPLVQPDDLLTEFSALDARVRLARMRRVAWSLLGCAALVGIVAALLPLVMDLVRTVTVV